MVTVSSSQPVLCSRASVRSPFILKLGPDIRKAWLGRISGSSEALGPGLLGFRGRSSAPPCRSRSPNGAPTRSGTGVCPPALGRRPEPLQRLQTRPSLFSLLTYAAPPSIDGEPRGSRRQSPEHAQLCLMPAICSAWWQKGTPSGELPRVDGWTDSRGQFRQGGPILKTHPTYAD